jgi:hypothetical protein
MGQNSAYLSQGASDGYHSQHSVCSTWTDIVVLEVKEVERRELGLLVALDGLADCPYALILEVVDGQIQGRQPAVDTQSVSDRCDALCSVSSRVPTRLLCKSAQLVV